MGGWQSWVFALPQPGLRALLRQLPSILDDIFRLENVPEDDIESVISKNVSRGFVVWNCST